jgi:hypothetical protein
MALAHVPVGDSHHVGRALAIVSSSDFKLDSESKSDVTAGVGCESNPEFIAYGCPLMVVEGGTRPASPVPVNLRKYLEMKRLAVGFEGLSLLDFIDVVVDVFHGLDVLHSQCIVLR